MTDGRRAAAGFSLLEILVAFSILALSLGVLLNIFGKSTANLQASGGYARALSLSRSLSARAELWLEQGPETRAGEQQEYRWEVRFSPYDWRREFSAEPRLTPYWAEVRVSWPGNGEQARSVTTRVLLLRAQTLT